MREQLIAQKGHRLALRLRQYAGMWPGGRTMEREGTEPVSGETQLGQKAASPALLAAENAVAACNNASRAAHEKAHGRATFFAEELRDAQRWIGHDPFFLAVELLKDGAERRLFFLSRGPAPSLFAEEGFLAPLSPLGRYALEVKNALKDGRAPDPWTLKVSKWRTGPPEFHTTEWDSCGVVTDVQMQQAEAHAIVERASLWSTDGKGKPVNLPPAAPAKGTAGPATEEARPDRASTQQHPAPAGEPRRGFGLTDVISSIDVDQLRSIDFPEDGPLVVTGSAGTGKTTVAMYRASYLLTEQAEARREDPTAPTYFRADQFIVLVRKEHLRPYLERLAVEMRLPTGIQCHTFEHWFREFVFRPYLRRDEKRVTYTSLPQPDWESATVVFHEQDIRRYLEREFQPSLERVRDEARELLSLLAVDLGTQPVPQRVSHSRQGTIVDGRVGLLKRLRATPRPWWRAVDMIRAFDEWRGALRAVKEFVTKDFDLRVWADALGDRIKAAEAALDALRSRTIDTVFRPDRIAKAFYASNEARERWQRALPQEDIEALSRTLGDPRRPYHRADEPVVLWLLEYLTNEMPAAGPTHLQQLPHYDHVVIDEAQYYAPATLRFVSRLARSPRQAVTYVGDLDQHFGSARTFSQWQDVLPEGTHATRVRRLEKIYRCSREVYKLLYELQPCLGLDRSLVPPREIDRFTGDDPEIVLLPSSDDEVNWVADRIESLTARSRGSSTAVVIPDRGDGRNISDRIVDALDQRGVEARIAYGEDMKESNEKVMVTTPDSIVGLEFDHVFVAGIDRYWSSIDASQRRELWVAATRGKRYLALTGTTRPDWMPAAGLGGVPVSQRD